MLVEWQLAWCLWVEYSIGEELLNWKLVHQLRSTINSEFVTEHRLVWRCSLETGCSMSEMYVGAVLFNYWYASTHCLNVISAATGSQCKSISALVTCSRGRRSQTRRAAAFKTRCSGARVDCGNPESVALP